MVVSTHSAESCAVLVARLPRSGTEFALDDLQCSFRNRGEVEPTGGEVRGLASQFIDLALRVMHVRELIDLAAVVAVHAPTLIRASRRIPEESVEGYWIASKCRLERWARTLKRLTNALAADDGGVARPESSMGVAAWPFESSATPFAKPQGVPPGPLTPGDRSLFRGVLEEILASEILTRVWTAAMCAYDRARHSDAMEPVAHSVLIGHMEARHRVLTLLVRPTGLEAEEAIQLNALRSRTERWTDALVGHLASEYDVAEFAIEPDRAREFAEDLVYQRRQKGGRYAWPLLLASLRTAFWHALSAESPNPELNARIAASVLACFPGEVFDGTGLVVSAWLLRISHVASEAEGMLEELLADSESGRGGEWERGRNTRWSS